MKGDVEFVDAGPGINWIYRYQSIGYTGINQLQRRRKRKRTSERKQRRKRRRASEREQKRNTSGRVMRGNSVLDMATDTMQ